MKQWVELTQRRGIHNSRQHKC